MHRATLFRSPKAEDICKYIENISQPDIDEPKATEFLNQRTPGQFESKFIIGGEIKRDDSDKNSYFQVYLHDVRMDVTKFQLTPCIVIIKGVLKISDSGEITVESADFRYPSINATFSFKDNKLALHDNDEMNDMTQNKSGFCAIL